jgi:hypothetical protein
MYKNIKYKHIIIEEDDNDIVSINKTDIKGTSLVDVNNYGGGCNGGCGGGCDGGCGGGCDGGCGGEGEGDGEEDTFTNYIDKEQQIVISSNCIFTKFSWNGAELIDRWELQRTINKKKVISIAKDMIKYYKKNDEFIYMDPIHIAHVGEKYYIVDGQHRLVAFIKIYNINKFPIQKIPCIIWTLTSNEEIDDLFDKINNRLMIDKNKLMKHKLILLLNLMETKWNDDIWGERRPRINKELFIEKIRNNDNCYKLDAEEIMEQIVKINNSIRLKKRNDRYTSKLSTLIHNKTEELDFFLGIDKELGWIDDISL